MADDITNRLYHEQAPKAEVSDGSQEQLQI
jgi:hypothetical protein